MCGEYTESGIQVALSSGSPPRVWGIPKLKAMVEKMCRITPTCVGNTIKEDDKMLNKEDHPHVCGEYFDIVRKSLSPQGSPPRVWGIPAADARNALTYRITPTCVGNTRLAPS